MAGTELFFLNSYVKRLMGVRLRDADEPSFSTAERIMANAKMKRLAGPTHTARQVDALPDGRFVYIGQPVPRVSTELQVVVNAFAGGKPGTQH